MPDPIPQACAIPYRRNGARLEFCLITTLGGKKWGFPKGIIEPGNSPEQTALIEAAEEAGLHGQIVGEPLGTFRYQKWNSDLDVVVFLMEVSHVDETWLESDVRERAWLASDEAIARLGSSELRPLLERAIERLTSGVP